MYRPYRYTVEFRLITRYVRETRFHWTPFFSSSYTWVIFFFLSSLLFCSRQYNYAFRRLHESSRQSAEIFRENSTPRYRFHGDFLGRRDGVIRNYKAFEKTRSEVCSEYSKYKENRKIVNAKYLHNLKMFKSEISWNFFSFEFIQVYNRSSQIIDLEQLTSSLFIHDIDKRTWQKQKAQICHPVLAQNKLQKYSI